MFLLLYGGVSMNAVIHIDANYFYAQIEALFRPSIRGKAFIVGGNQETRKGIVLTKSPEAKKMGVKTGTSIKEALKINPNILILPANYPMYFYFCKRMREIVLQFTDVIKPFGSDEMWAQLYGSRDEVMKTVEDIRQALWRQLCLTVSIGVGDNLPYAKLGSDLAPNDGVFEAWNEDREFIVYPLPVSDLLYVGPSATKKFASRGIYTIGDLANSCPDYICNVLRCKTGSHLWTMANGLDRTTVATTEAVDNVKSIGNSNTMPRDLNTDDDVMAAFYMLAESVSLRMRESGFQATILEISIRDNELFSCTRQMKLQRPTSITAEMVPLAMELFKRHYRWNNPIRSLGIRGSGLVPDDAVYQLSLFDDEKRREKLDRLERRVDMIRGRFGLFSVQRAILMKERLKSINANNDPGDAQTFYVY